ncbi:MAG: Asp-tRNA(Asn)/Glu-tRNA(Gln) amidotransferase subunit GatB [Candidatus Micrarchaeia archaeon]|jgi:aspartyl-tRNA(Asn)/glutamyl-tRNA(Gln) amidotransferase subunit B
MAENEMAPMIGLEIHVSLKSDSKLFCACSAVYGNATPNTNVCEVCTGQPGAKPMALNEKAIENAVKISLALGCSVEKDVVMQRKHYWYPDLPSGYQRTSKPLGVGGVLEKIRIREAHVEEDPGRYDLKTGRTDYNRSGTALLEIVTDPDMESPQQAREWLDQLQSILEYLGATRDEAGSTRVDANVSIRGSNRVEVKNINSFKGVFTALTYEIARQKNLLKNGLPVIQETRHFDEDRGITLGMRKKETVADYRYIPDPDVPPLALTDGFVAQIQKSLPELPSQKRARFEKQYGMREEEAFAICLEKEFADSFEESAKTSDAKILAPFCRGVVRKQLNYRGLAFKNSKLSAHILSDLAGMVAAKEVTEKVAEELLIVFLDKGTVPREHAKAAGLLGVQKGGELEAAAEAVIKENPKAVADFLAGNEKSLHFLAGQLMKATKGKAAVHEVHAVLKKKMGK